MILETNLVSHIWNIRVKVSHQNDGFSCRSRLCLNAILLEKTVLDIHVLFDLFYQSKLFFNLLKKKQFKTFKDIKNFLKEEYKFVKFMRIKQKKSFKKKKFSLPQPGEGSHILPYLKESRCPHLGISWEKS